MRRREVFIPKSVIARQGPCAVALIEHVAGGGAQNVGTFRPILMELMGVSSQGTAGFWTNGPDGAGLAYRTHDSGYPITDDQPAALTKRCHLIADAYKALQTEVGPDQRFWMSLAGHLEGIAEEIKKRFAA
jgi:hypothetical protein